MSFFRHDKKTAEAGLPVWKRRLDISFVLLILPVLLPIAALTALVIQLVSKGPVLFRQERVGFGGKRFICFKFRTMFARAETISHEDHLRQLITSNAPMLKMDAQGDARIIPLGRWLRSSGLDELPQLINVFRGEMSVVGPRPCLPYESEKYEEWHRERFHAVPGLTGLWQVSGKNKTTFAEMIKLDVAYVRNMSLGLDLQIMLKTVPALVVQIWETWQARQVLRSTQVSRAIVPAGTVNRVVNQ